MRREQIRIVFGNPTPTLIIVPNDSAMAVKQVFIIDDHAVFRHGVTYLIDAEETLEICGVASCAAEALDLIGKSSPDVVVSDLTLPDKNGLELLKDLKVLHPKLPVLVVSMHDELIYAERVLRSGGRGYLMKENSEKLIEALLQVLGGTVYVSPEVTNHFLTSLVDGDKVGFSFPLARLTDRELEVFELIGQGKATEAIADQLNISGRTVDAQLTHS
ncbi:MAG: DNA-binding NarL/FixJ family response regulator [Verrucomicrobiales bacterium]|jgi:DNA-binding NarL/FixJ family response regulator